MVKRKTEKENQIKTVTRPPVVTIMGHVDHGKTTLLDAIRQTNVVATEAGGITQRISAYQIEVAGKKITFIDTPGHAAFSQMRSRGARVADIVILVVAAEDGVMPQTREAIQFIKEAKIPLIVAINKIDLPQANIEKVKKQLAKEDVLVEGFGGAVVVVPISAKKKEGLDDLLEMILLVAEMQDLRASPACPSVALVIESHLDKNRGPVATVIVKEGTLKVGQEVYIEDIKSKIRAMIDDQGKKTDTASPSQPVEILGLAKVPPMGAIMDTIPGDLTTRQVAVEIPQEELAEHSAWQLQLAKDVKEVRIILKTDVSGSAEAIVANLPKEVKVLYQETGDINQSDILLAKNQKALLIGFNVNVPKDVQKVAAAEKVGVKIYHVIYELLDEISQLAEAILVPTVTEEVTGRGRIIAQFGQGETRIAGCKIEEGFLARGATVRLLRDGQEISQAKIKTLKRLKENVPKVILGEECGLTFEPQLDFILSDIIESVRVKK